LGVDEYIERLEGKIFFVQDLKISAPSNLRYGNKETNSVVGCMIDPVGNAAGHPRTTHWEFRPKFLSN
jgi:hypothetical protein